MTNLNDADRRTQERLADAAAETQAWLDRNAAEEVCDFCAHVVPRDQQTTYITAAIVETLSAIEIDTLGAGTISHVLSPEWCACPGCAEVIDQGDAHALAVHVVAVADVERIGSEPTVDDVEGLYVKFFAGNPRKVEAVST